MVVDDNMLEDEVQKLLSIIHNQEVKPIDIYLGEYSQHQKD